MKQSIVNWIPWPDDGTGGLPENTRIILKLESGVVLAGFFYRPTGERRLMQSTGQEHRFLDHPQTTHYALASDLETVHEIDGDKCGILPRALIDRARATIEESSMVQDEDRLRLLENRVLRLERRLYVEPTSAQEERERKEGGHE